MLSPNPDDTRKPGNSEKYWRTTRLFVGTLMGFQTALVFNVCIASAIIVVMLGGMAFLVGGSAATDANVKAGWLMIALMVIGPFLWPLLTMIGTINILREKRPLLIIVCCALSIVIELALLLAIYRADMLEPIDLESGSFPVFVGLAIVFIVIQLAGLVIGIRMEERKGEPRNAHISE